MTDFAIEGTDLMIAAYVNAGGDLVMRVNKAGICVFDTGLQNATDEVSPARLMTIGALTRPVLRDLRNPAIVDILAPGPKG